VILVLLVLWFARCHLIKHRYTHRFTRVLVLLLGNSTRFFFAYLPTAQHLHWVLPFKPPRLRIVACRHTPAAALRIGLPSVRGCLDWLRLPVLLLPTQRMPGSTPLHHTRAPHLRFATLLAFSRQPYHRIRCRCRFAQHARTLYVWLLAGSGRWFDRCWRFVAVRSLNTAFLPDCRWRAFTTHWTFPPRLLYAFITAPAARIGYLPFHRFISRSFRSRLRCTVAPRFYCQPATRHARLPRATPRICLAATRGLPVARLRLDLALHGCYNCAHIPTPHI